MIATPLEPHRGGRPPSRAERGLIEQIDAARAAGKALQIRGHGSKAAYLPAARGAIAAVEGRVARAVCEPLFTSPLAGIVSHQPSELVITVGAGTPVAEVVAALTAHHQHLPFDPLAEVDGLPATIGGMVASGWAGPARAYAGSLRDHLLGVRLIDGQGRVLDFGGQVMKNVAGYDLSRLLAGSWGRLGLISQVSLKVLPQPQQCLSLRWPCGEADAIRLLNTWAGLPLPLNASAWWAGTLVLRLAGSHASVQAASALVRARQPGGERIPDGLAQPFWQGLAEQRDGDSGGFFADARAAVCAGQLRLWRLALPATTAPLRGLDGGESAAGTLIEWGGALRWVLTRAGSRQVHAAAAQAGGSARLWWGRCDEGAAAADPVRQRIEQALIARFDPAGVFA